MPRYVDEDDRDEDDDDRWQAEADEDDKLPEGVYHPDDEEPTITCPYCHEEVREDSPRCPHCENYLSREDAPSGPQPWWILIGVVLCLLVVYLWIVGRG